MGMRPGRKALVLVGMMALATSSAALGAEEAALPRHGMAMYDDLKYGPSFEHFDYVNSNAPVGGTATFSAIGSFDTLNPFIIRGTPASGVGLLYETLTVGALDEPFSRYGLLAESIRMPEDRSWVAFTLRPEARFHDGEPVTVEDVIWSFNTLKEEGAPLYRYYYANVVSAEKTGEREVTFRFEGGTNRELPLIISELPVLPKHYYDEVEFNKTTLTPPVGSGPYRIERVDPGRSITYERDPSYWGWHLPVNAGRYNFERIVYDYYRDTNVALEAFKAGAYDIRLENTAKLWATAYTGEPFEKGRIVKEELPDESDTRMQGFVFNTRREIFEDPKVRQALAYAFDFEWTNQNLFYGAYDRIDSYFSGSSELASSGLPSEAELELLEPLRGQIPKQVFTATYQPPSTDQPGGLRANLRQALELLNQAGWVIESGRLVNQETGRPMTFEILLVSPEFERIVLPFIQNLERLGVRATVRVVDTAQYQNRLDDFDFDMTSTVWGQSASPGNEQREYWGSKAAETPGSRNLAGIKNPAIDVLIDAVIGAETRDQLETAVHALDRVLLWGHYVIPHWQIQVYRIAYWNKFGRPEIIPPYGLDLFAWWIDEDKVAALSSGKSMEGGARAATVN
ncbi:MAG: extracellular solute-binding protein [Geminicoccaceae bacterium]